MQVCEAFGRQLGQLAFVTRELENITTAPRRDLWLAFSQPVMDRLDRRADPVRYGGCPAKLVENLGDNMLHTPLNIRTSDMMQAPAYAIFAVPPEIPSWQTIRMQDKAFDTDLVLETMKARKVTQTDMARVMGLPSQSAFSNIVKGKRRVTAQEAATAYRFLGIKHETNFRIAPVIGITSAGRWREAIELPLGHMPYPSNIASEAAFGLEVSGDSMDLLIDDGGWVLIDPAKKELHPGSCYLISNSDHEATVKMYQRSPARFEPCSTNSEHKSFLVADAEFTVIGKVVWKGAPVG